MHASPEVLVLRETFQIARGAADEETVVVASFEHDGIVAHGEGAPVDYWGETPEAIREALEADGGALLGDDLFASERVLARVSAWDGPQGAKMALDGVLHDWLGKRVGQPVWRLLGTDRVTPPTSYTIGIDSVEGTAEPVVEHAVERHLRALRAVPGSHAARALGLQVMLGCMIESELGIAQAAQLASLVDYIDLDGHLLISSRPFSGLGLLDGRLVLSDKPGLGVERTDG